MKQALILAKRAKGHDDVPIGAAIVRGGRIIARGENLVQKKKNPMLHAEIVAIGRACKKLGSKFLDECDIYVSLEPCAMCAAAISYARISRIYFAARDVKGGALLHNSRIFDTDAHLWRPEIIEIPEHAAESAQMLKEFFNDLRTRNSGRIAAARPAYQ
ncbi:MAG: nucleoside deaminase [Rickettsiales bacterium]|nr:nucleoside deaminase [Rickettsiales bacterium]